MANKRPKVEPNSQRLSEYLTIKQAADFLGVCRDTLRRWEKQNKLQSYRNPMNGYRLYKKDDLEKLLEGITSVE